MSDQSFATSLSLLVFLPLAGALTLALIPSGRVRAIRIVTLVFSLACFGLAVFLYLGFDGTDSAMQYVERHRWISIAGLSIDYHLGVDGISLLLVMLTTFLTPLAALSSWSAISSNQKAYYILLLLLETSMLGVLVSLDLILFYIFWDLMLIPMYFIIGAWGSEGRVYAAVKFIIYTFIGSLLMLVGIIYLYLLNGASTFDLVEITRRISAGELRLAPRQELWLFLAFFIAFAIKVPLFPLHTWLPDAHVEAPTPGSVILAGVLLKMGTYGLIRFCLPLFPNASVAIAPIISVLALIGIIYGALVAMVQPDLKKLVAYSSVSHLGLVVLGIFAFNHQGLEGATYQMVNHGVSTGTLFMLVGMLYDRRHTRLIAEFGGLAHPMPLYAAFFMLVILSSIGLPLLNGFVGEFLVLQGTFLNNRWHAALAVTGVIWSAGYMLWAYQRVMLGEVSRAENQGLPDLDARESWLLVPVAIVIVLMGVWTEPFLRPMDASVDRIVAQIEAARSEGEALRVKR